MISTCLLFFFYFINKEIILFKKNIYQINPKMGSYLHVDNLLCLNVQVNEGNHIIYTDVFFHHSSLFLSRSYQEEFLHAQILNMELTIIKEKK